MFDILLVIALVLFALSGWRKGLILSVFSIVGYFVSLFIARALSPSVTDFIILNTGIDASLDNLVGNQIRNITELNIPTSMVTGFATKSIVSMICFFVIFLISSMIMSKIVRLINRAGRLPIIGQINRIGGLVFGVAKGILLTFVVLAVLTLVVNTGDVRVKKELDSTTLVKVMYENNPIVKIIKTTLPI